MKNATPQLPSEAPALLVVGGEPSRVRWHNQPITPPNEQDLLIHVEAVGINPVDYKVMDAQSDQSPPHSVGYDCCGSVVARGADVRGIRVGDRVFYAGDIARPGCWQSYHHVDHRICAIAPQSTSTIAAASLLLTHLTAYEALFFDDRE
jgi:NADPH:quinone reductase-like Zn-dependent oxidoreductase